jgi:hypothetical protein
MSWKNRIIRTGLADPSKLAPNPRNWRKHPKEQAEDLMGDESTDTMKVLFPILVEIKNKIIFGGNYFTDFLPPSRCWIVWDKENTGNFADAELAWTSFDKGVRLYHWLWNVIVNGVLHLADFPDPISLNTWYHVAVVRSGTTLIACENLGRICRGMEIAPEYIAVTLQRYKDTFGKEPELVP